MYASPSTRRAFLQRLVLSGAATSTTTLLAACGGGAATAPAAAPTTPPAPTTAPAKPAVPPPSSSPSAATSPLASAAPSPSAQAASAPAASAAPVTGNIEFWSRETQSNGARQPLIQQRLAAFDQQRGTYSTPQFMIFQESVDKTQAALAAGTVPDLGQQGPDVSLQFAAAGNLLPLDDMKSRLQDQFLALQDVAFVNWQGHSYGLPWYLETRVLFYHKDLLDQAGVKPPTTWQEWLDAARALTRGEEQYGFIFPPDGPFPGQLFVPLATAAGGNLLDKDGKVDANTQPFTDALQLLSDLYSSKSMPQATPTYKTNDVVQLFLLKKVAMMWMTPDLMLNIQQQQPQLKDTVGAVLTPPQKAGGTSRSFLGGFDLFVFKAGKNPDGAKALLEALFDPTWYGEYLNRIGGSALPATSAGAGQSLFQSDALLKILLQQETSAVRYGGTLTSNAPFLGEAEGKLVFAQPVLDVWTGKRSVIDAVATMNTSLKQLAKQA